MLTIIVPGAEHYDEEQEEFITVGDYVLELEHSLVSLSKWESFYEKPFLGGSDKTNEEVTYYIECMILTTEYPKGLISRLNKANLETINKYINAKRSATWFTETNNSRNTEIVTSELVYYWMFSATVPLECETWHLNRLFTLLRVFSEKNDPKKKKISRADIARRNEELNAQRRAQLGTSG